MKKFWAIFFILLPGVLYASAFDVGLVFLLIYPGAKATAMGGAFTAIADDPTAMYYNVAGIGQFKKMGMSFVHSNWLKGLAPDMYYEYFSLVKPLRIGVGGIAITYSNYGKFDAYDENENYLGSWHPNDLCIQAGYGFVAYQKNENNKLYAGISTKFMRSFLAPAEILRRALGLPAEGGTAVSFAIGGGILWKTGKTFKFKRKTIFHKVFGDSLKLGFQFGSLVDNIGPGVRYTAQSEKDPIPTLLRLGMAFLMQGKYYKITLSGDVNKVLVRLFKDIEEKGQRYAWEEAWKHIGLEIALLNIFSVRAGYFLDKEGAREGFTYGAGLKIGNFQFDISDDHKIYSFDQGSNLRYSLSIWFNNKPKGARTDEQEELE